MKFVMCAHGICPRADVCHCYYCIYDNIIEYPDNFVGNNRKTIFKYRSTLPVTVAYSVWSFNTKILKFAKKIRDEKYILSAKILHINPNF